MTQEGVALIDAHKLFVEAAAFTSLNVAYVTAGVDVCVKRHR